MSPLPHQNRRRTVLVNPRLQIGAALLFSAVVLVGGALFAWLIYRGARDALWEASVQGHFRFDTPYQVVSDQVVRQLLQLFSVVAVAGVVTFLLIIRRIQAGMNRLIEVLRLSGEGDLSSPTDAPGLREVAIFGAQLDAVREYTLGQIREIRSEVELLRKEPVSPEEFRSRWDGLKEKIGRIAP
ncbi:MAG: hypothetical protein Kow00128_06050 [Deltaproteobacteria bacterium]